MKHAATLVTALAAALTLAFTLAALPLRAVLFIYLAVFTTGWLFLPSRPAPEAPHENSILKKYRG